MEKTLVIIKPDALARGIGEEVLRDFDKIASRVGGRRIALVAVSSKDSTQERWERHYVEAIKRVGPVIRGDYIPNELANRPAIIAIYEGQGVRKAIKEKLGIADTDKAAHGTIRRKYHTPETPRGGIAHASSHEHEESFVEEYLAWEDLIKKTSF